MRDPIWGLMNALFRIMRSKLILIFFLFSYLHTQGQQTTYSVLFYNSENLFDWKNDPHTNDDEFTSEGDRHWTYNRFQTKIKNVSKALIGAAGWDSPAIIGICEVENKFVLDQLINNTSLKSINLGIIHKESPDPRGIDVALLYNKEIFDPLSYEYYPIINEDGSIRRTREILYTSGLIEKDTIHFFINHWPSRYSGILETKPWRNKAAGILKQKTDSIFQMNPKTKIIVMGDFNDQPKDQSIQDYLKAQNTINDVSWSELYNLSYGWIGAETGTLKYQSQWFVYDQIIVSGALINAKSGLYTETDWASIFSPDFLLEEDETYGGLKPFRTYSGFGYNGGFGDHLPIKIKISVR